MKNKYKTFVQNAILSLCVAAIMTLLLYVAVAVYQWRLWPETPEYKLLAVRGLSFSFTLTFLHCLIDDIQILFKGGSHETKAQI